MILRRLTLMLCCSLFALPSLAAAQESGAGSTPSGGAMGAAGAGSLGSTMSTTGAGNPPGGAQVGVAPAPDGTSPLGSKAAPGDNTPETAGARGSSGVGSNNP